jgi:hypothetical protein
MSDAMWEGNWFGFDGFELEKGYLVPVEKVLNFLIPIR